jgi:hypothetical protein
MEALSVDEIPTGKGWQYEPKWDGFRCLVFRNGGKVDLRSKAGRSLTRYFPELVEAILDVKADKFAIDGEIVLPHDGAFSFDDLLQRIHPAPSETVGGRDSRAFDRVRSASRYRRPVAHAPAAARAPAAAGSLRSAVFEKQAANSIVAGDDQAERSNSLAQRRWRSARWHHRQAP